MILTMYTLIIAFITIGINEAIIKPLAKYFIQQKIKKYAPSVFKFLDANMPELLIQYNGKQLTQIVEHKLKDVMTEPINQKDIELIFTLYDPRITANKHHKK